MKKTYNDFFFDVLGLKQDDNENADTDDLMNLVINCVTKPRQIKTMLHLTR
jgi:hypothetical protein